MFRANKEQLSTFFVILIYKNTKKVEQYQTL